jgi:hypothetical protein
LAGGAANAGVARSGDIHGLKGGCRMEPVVIVLIAGLVGGVALAVILGTRRRGAPSIFVARPLVAPSPALINMAHIRVEGIGGLGLVAAVAAVAVWDPRIRLAMSVSAVLGSGLAMLLIAARRRALARRSNADGRDDLSMLHIGGERGGK